MRLEDVRVDKLQDEEKSLCNRCATNIAGLCRHCPEEECGWDLCIACCQDLATEAAAGVGAAAAVGAAAGGGSGGAGGDDNPEAAAASPGGLEKLKQYVCRAVAAVGSVGSSLSPAAAAGSGGKDSSQPHVPAVGVVGSSNGEGSSGGAAAVGTMTGEGRRVAYLAKREKLRQFGWVMTCPNPKCPSVGRQNQQQGVVGGEAAAADGGVEEAAGGDGDVTGGQLRCIPGAAALELVRIVRGEDPLAVLKKVVEVRGTKEGGVGGGGGRERWVGRARAKTGGLVGERGEGQRVGRDIAVRE